MFKSKRSHFLSLRREEGNCVAEPFKAFLTCFYWADNRGRRDVCEDVPYLVGKGIWKGVI
jgi:hypothetical protein